MLQNRPYLGIVYRVGPPRSLALYTQFAVAIWRNSYRLEKQSA